MQGFLVLSGIGLVLSFAQQAVTEYRQQALATVTLRTRTTSTTTDEQGTREGQSYSTSIYVSGNRERHEQVFYSFGALPQRGIIGIHQCDLKRRISMDPNLRTFVVRRCPPLEKRDSVPEQVEITDFQECLVITVETIDTGERRNLNGFALRHLQQKETRPSGPGPLGARISTRDGWYLDLPRPEGCSEFIPVTKALAPFAWSGFPRVEIGNIPAVLPTPVEEIRTSVWQESGVTFVEKTELLELSGEPIEADLFEIPRDYRPALRRPHGSCDLLVPDTWYNRMMARCHDLWWTLRRG